MNDAQTLDRGIRAKQLLESDIYQEGWDACRQAILSLIESTPLANVDQAEDLRRCLKLLRDVKLNLEMFVKLGANAQFKIAQQNVPPEQRVHLFRP
jgi:hypothetical protein